MLRRTVRTKTSRILRVFARLPGITLFELIAAAVILGVFALIVVPNIVSALGLSKQSTLQTTLSEVQGSSDQFYGIKGVYPTYPGTTVGNQPGSGVWGAEINPTADPGGQVFVPDFLRNAPDSSPATYGLNPGNSTEVYFGVESGGAVFSTQTPPSEVAPGEYDWTNKPSDASTVSGLGSAAPVGYGNGSLDVFDPTSEAQFNSLCTSDLKGTVEDSGSGCSILVSTTASNPTTFQFSSFTLPSSYTIYVPSCGSAVRIESQQGITINGRIYAMDNQHEGGSWCSNPLPSPAGGPGSSGTSQSANGYTVIGGQGGYGGAASGGSGGQNYSEDACTTSCTWIYGWGGGGGAAGNVANSNLLDEAAAAGYSNGTWSYAGNVIELLGASVTVNNTVAASGSQGSPGAQVCVGAGGGNGGGSVILEATGAVSLSSSSVLNANGGSGGAAYSNSQCEAVSGGNGGNGLVGLQYQTLIIGGTSYSGDTTSTTGGYCTGYPGNLNEASEAIDCRVG